jgi:hypothetical protein
MSSSNGHVTVHLPTLLLSAAERLGVPAFVLVVVLLVLVPRIDRGIQIADRVDAQMSFLAATCGAPRAPLAQ